MTKTELIKYKMHPDNVEKITGARADLYIFTHEQINEVIQDELEKFAEFINGDTISHLFDEITNGDIESYLTKSYE